MGISTKTFFIVNSSYYTVVANLRSVEDLQHNFVCFRTCGWGTILLSDRVQTK